MLPVDKRKKQYDISGSVPATFEIDFPYWAKSQIGAILTTPDGDVPLTQDVDYSLSDPGDTGTLTRIGTWDATATRLTIYRDLDIIQTILDLTNGGELDADALELALDEVVAMIQQVREELDRVVRFPITEAESSPDMPSAEERALNFLAFDVDGSPIASPGSAGEYPVSDLMGPVLAAATLLAAQLGLGLLPSGASAAISAAMKTFLAAATVLDMQKAVGIVPSGASTAISAAMQGVLASPGSGWTDILATIAGSGWLTALQADATKLATALAAGIGTGWDTALASAAINLAYPVGSYYVQYPDASSNTDSTEFPTSQRPATLFGGTWAEQWSTASVFFRTRGTLSDTDRSSGLQDSGLQGHDHKIWVQTIDGSGSSNNRIRDDSGLVSIDAARTSGYQNIATWASNRRLMSGYAADDVPNGTPKIAAETRVVNRRIKVWKRTA